MRLFLTLCLLALASSAHCGTVIETEKPKNRVPIPATCHYRPTPIEQTYYSKLDAAETETYSKPNASRDKRNAAEQEIDSDFPDEPEEPYSIHGKKDKYVSWFGIVRGISKEPNSPNRYRLLLEQKYFDRLTDCGMMLVSIDGAGDFLASVDGDEAQSIPPLSLVRAYGKVIEETDGLPRIEAEYMRVWPWFTFTFMNLGPEDRGNPKWRALCELCRSEEWIYDGAPTRNYYLRVLGNPKDFAVSIKAKDRPRP